MAKIRGPLLSMSATGQIGKSHVYGKWRGVGYARQLVTPANPQTTQQSFTRDLFRFLNDLYRHFGPLGLAVWEAYAAGRPMIPRNGTIKINLPNMREEVDLAQFVASPGAKGGPALGGFTAAPGANSGEIEVTLVAPDLPTGWTVSAGNFSIVLDQDPNLAYTGPYFEKSIATPGPYTWTFPGLGSAIDFMCSGWFVYIRPDASLAYSPSAGQIATSAP